MEEVFQKESPYRKLTYTQSFKEMVVKHPRLLSIFQDLENKMKDKIQTRKAFVGSSLEDKGIKITVIDKSQSANNKPLGAYFKVGIGGEAFFVKTVPGYYDLGKGAKELASLNKAKELLKDLKDVEVVDFQLGYEDNKGTTYFVSKWEEGLHLDDYSAELASKEHRTKDEKLVHNLASEHAELFARFKEIRLLLSRFVDVSEHNILYNPKTKKLKVFDVH